MTTAGRDPETAAGTAAVARSAAGVVAAEVAGARPTRRVSAHPAALALLAALVVPACATVGDAYPDTLAAWHDGRRTVALALARAEYDRYRDGNDLAEARVRRVVDDAYDALAERPIAPRAGIPAPIAMHNGAPGELHDAVRADLLSGRITAILRATRVVANLRLPAHAPDLITVVFRRDPVLPDGDLLADVSVALRSVAAKRAALDALEALGATP